MPDALTGRCLPILKGAEWVLSLFFFVVVVFFTELFNHSKYDCSLKHIIQNCSNAYEFLRSYPSYENVVRSANSWIFLPSVFFNVSGGSKAIYLCVSVEWSFHQSWQALCFMRLKPWPCTKWMPWAGQWHRKGFKEEYRAWRARLDILRWRKMRINKKII